MDLFAKAKKIRLRSHTDKYLIACNDQESVVQDRDGTGQNSIWTVEFVQGNLKHYIRLKSCYGTYLAASNTAIVPGVPGKKVVQAKPSQPNPATEWEPLRDGMQTKLRSLWGNYLRPHGGIPPWRNAVTHDVPHRDTTMHKILWDVQLVEARPVHRRPQLALDTSSAGRSHSVSSSGRSHSVCSSPVPKKKTARLNFRSVPGTPDGNKEKAGVRTLREELEEFGGFHVSSNHDDDDDVITARTPVGRHVHGSSSSVSSPMDQRDKMITS